MKEAILLYRLSREAESSWICDYKVNGICFKVYLALDDFGSHFWIGSRYSKYNKTDVERRQTLGHPGSINPNMINHVPQQSPLIF